MTKTEDQPQVLNFETDKGGVALQMVASGLTLAIVGWMGSGFIAPATQAEPDKEPVDVSLVSVAVESSSASLVPEVFTAEGQAVPDRDTILRVGMSGDIAELLVSKGDMVERDQVIARFDTATAQANLVRAQESLVQAQREYDNALELQQRGIATADRVTAAKAGLASAEANLVSAEDAVSNAEVKAPFAGRLEELDINEGEFVSAGSQVARIVDNMPLTVTIQIPQQSRSKIKVGQLATVSLITGEEVDGRVNFIGSSADASTRTFAAEIEIANEDGLIPAGVSAQVKISTGELMAHFVSPAILSLDTEGTLGVKAVDADNKVEFHEVSIVQAQTDGIWVSGLPESINLITIGQAFVNDGETVKPIVAEGEGA